MYTLLYTLLSRHPSYRVLSEFTDVQASRRQARIAAHLVGCASCRTAVQVFRIARAELRATEHDVPASLRDRVMASIATGPRVILPTTDVTVPTARLLTAPRLAASAGIVAALMVPVLFMATHRADAGSTTGVMRLTPALPRPGESVRVSYDAPASLAKRSSLVVRARLRSVHSAAYQDEVPVQSIATIARGGNASYAGTFTLPDSIVYAALAVEDSAGVVIDDHGRRTWEVLTTLDGSRPSFASLYQRANDMMGRSFEDAHETTRRMTELYPDSIEGWSYLHSFQDWLGIGQADTVLAQHRAVLARFEQRWRSAATIPAGVLGRLAWYSRTVDTAATAYWRARLMREAPTSAFGLRWRLLQVAARARSDHDTAAMFRRLDSLWVERSVERPRQIAAVSLDLAVAGNLPDEIERWSARVLSAASDSLSVEIDLAERLAAIPSLSRAGVQRLRALLPQLDRTPVVRYLSEPRGDAERRGAARRRRVLASLGRALVASGEMRAGLETLELAARDGWDMSIVRALRDGSFAAGDSAVGWEMTARLVVDPLTSDSVRRALSASAERAVGAARWASLERESEALFAERILENSQMQTVPGAPHLRDWAGRTLSFAELAGRHTTVVVFWSRFCGWALDDLNDLKDTARRLQRVGTHVVVVIDDESGPSPALSRLLLEDSAKLPVYFDADHSMSKALNNWGTPIYYVLDGQGRVRFRGIPGARDAFVRAEAVRVVANRSVTGGESTPAIKR